MTKKERAKVIAEMIANPEKLKALVQAAALKDNPRLTELQLECGWKQAAELLGI